MAYEESRKIKEPTGDISLSEETIPPTTVETIPTDGKQDPDQNTVPGNTSLNPEATAYGDVPSILADQSYSSALNTTSSAIQSTSGPRAYPLQPAPEQHDVNPQYLSRMHFTDPMPPPGVHVELSRGFSSSDTEPPDGHSSLCLDIHGCAGGMGGMPIRSGERADRRNLSLVTMTFKDTSGRTEILDYPLYRDDGSVYTLPNTS
jgi:hypothetical protein